MYDEPEPDLHPVIAMSNETTTRAKKIALLIFLDVAIFAPVKRRISRPTHYSSFIKILNYGFSICSFTKIFLQTEYHRFLLRARAKPHPPHNSPALCTM